MGVLVFDIDGTLTETNRVDGEFFKAAVRTVLPQAELTSFDGFTEFTDTAILRSVCEQVGSSYDAVQGEVHEHFLAGLRQALASDPTSFAAVPGAPQIFSHVRRAGWVPAIATGGWRASAELKLRAAAISTEEVPLATSTERERRAEIIRLAVSEASPRSVPEDIVYVGDGVWDVRACRELGIGFIGRAGTSESAELLTQAGAPVVLENFAEPYALTDLLVGASQLTPLRQ